MEKKTSLLDLDSMVYTVAYRQYEAGNRDKPKLVVDHIKRFINTVEKNSKCTHALRFFQDLGHSNYRNVLLPEYKGHRVKTPDFIECWKPTIVEAYKDFDAIALTNIESDDAINIAGRDIGLANVTVISSDKDMGQMACDHYNPFKQGKADDPSRWFTVTKEQAEFFFWQQVITGDSTDMPGELCGIVGVGPATVKKKFAELLPTLSYAEIAQKMYTEKYGEEEGFERANRTFMMVRLLEKEQSYLPLGAETEVELLLKLYSSRVIELKNTARDLFGDTPTPGAKLFK